jgi:hypothetical protein
MEVVISPEGLVRCLYGEELDLLRLGRVTIRRGSYVEPDQQGRWMADLSPLDGPRLGPFELRSEALVAERDWLEQHWLLGPTA